MAEAFRVKGRDGYLASVQAVIRVNAEQASKRLRQEPTLRFSEEGPQSMRRYERMGKSPDGLRLLQRSISKILSAKQ